MGYGNNNREYPGYFISLEGGEGSGKTSHIAGLADDLREKGLKVFLTREPGGTNIGEQVRGILGNLKNTEMHPRTETLLFQSARAQNVEQNIIPRLKDGEIVIADRFADSTIAYQGYGHKQEIDTMEMLIKYATGGLMPDCTVFLDVDIETGLRRRKSSDEWNRLDTMGIEFYKRVREGYLKMARLEPKRWLVVDANPPKEEVYEELRRGITNRLMVHGFLESENACKERRL